MVYNTQVYFFFFGIFPSSGILETRKHDVSETDPVSETSCFLVSRIPDDGKVQKKNPVNLCKKWLLNHLYDYLNNI
jgi:hypothetical protein